MVDFVDLEPQRHLRKEHTCSPLLTTTPQLDSLRSVLVTTLTHHMPRMELASFCSKAEGINNSPEASLEIWLHSLPVVLKHWIDLIGMLPNV